MPTESRPLRKIDIGLIALTINFLTLSAGIVWGSSQFHAGLDAQRAITSELHASTKELGKVISDHEGRIRVLEDRTAREARRAVP
jgi:hypothetical protein